MIARVVPFCKTTARPREAARLGACTRANGVVWPRAARGPNSWCLPSRSNPVHGIRPSWRRRRTPMYVHHVGPPACGTRPARCRLSVRGAPTPCGPPVHRSRQCPHKAIWACLPLCGRTRHPLRLIPVPVCWSRMTGILRPNMTINPAISARGTRAARIVPVLMMFLPVLMLAGPSRRLPPPPRRSTRTPPLTACRVWPADGNIRCVAHAIPATRSCRRTRTPCNSSSL